MIMTTLESQNNLAYITSEGEVANFIANIWHCEIWSNFWKKQTWRVEGEGLTVFCHSEAILSFWQKAKMAKNPKVPHNIKCNDQSKQVEQKWGNLVSDSFSFGAQFSPNSLIVF